jgi:membrane protein involved in colicin uptake
VEVCSRLHSATTHNINMSENWLSCKGCVGSDPTRDTVKINASQIANKENVTPLGAAGKNQSSSHTQECGKALEQGTQRWVELQEEAAKVRRWQQEAREAAEAAEARAAEEEELRRKIEEEQRRRKLEEEVAARKAVEVTRLREEARRASEEAERLLREAEAAEAAQKEEEEMRRAEQQVQVWCKAHGFQDVNVERKTFKGKKYALHTAVKHQESEMVKMLIKCGARRDLKDSRGQTPRQVAEKISKSGGKDGVSQAILDALQ